MRMLLHSVRLGHGAYSSYRRGPLGYARIRSLARPQHAHHQQELGLMFLASCLSCISWVISAVMDDL